MSSQLRELHHSQELPTPGRSLVGWNHHELNNVFYDMQKIHRVVKFTCWAVTTIRKQIRTYVDGETQILTSYPNTRGSCVYKWPALVPRYQRSLVHEYKGLLRKDGLSPICTVPSSGWKSQGSFKSTGVNTPHWLKLKHWFDLYLPKCSHYRRNLNQQVRWNSLQPS